MTSRRDDDDDDSAWSCVLLAAKVVEEDGTNAAAVEQVNRSTKAENRMMVVWMMCVCVCVCVCVCDDTTMIDTGWWCYCRWTCCCDDGNFEEREVGVDLTRQRSSRESSSFDVKCEKNTASAC
jgi:hypothetical protein